MGLDKNYVLESTLWKRVEMTPARLKEIVTDMKSKTSTIHQSLFGFSLIDPQGKPVGIWYSILSARTAFQMKENNRVMIHTPDLRTYEKFEDGFRGLTGTLNGMVVESQGKIRKRPVKITGLFLFAEVAPEREITHLD